MTAHTFANVLTFNLLKFLLMSKKQQPIPTDWFVFTSPFLASFRNSRPFSQEYKILNSLAPYSQLGIKSALLEVIHMKFPPMDGNFSSIASTVASTISKGSLISTPPRVSV